MLEAAKGSYDHYRQVCIHGKMREDKSKSPQTETPDSTYSLLFTWDCLEEPPVELLGKLGPVGQRHPEPQAGAGGAPPLLQCDSVPDGLECGGYWASTQMAKGPSKEHGTQPPAVPPSDLKAILPPVLS